MGELAEDYGVRCVINFSLYIVLLTLDHIGNLLLKRLLLATTQANETKEDFIKFDRSLREENPTEVATMESDLATWEADHSSRPDPYRLPKSSK
jgi:hypothetical protein